MSRPERGAYGNKRGKELQKRKATNRQNNPRYRFAMEEVRRQQEALDNLIAKQKSAPEMGETQGAIYAAEVKNAEEELKAAQAREEAARLVEEPEKEAVVMAAPKFSTKKLPKDGEGNFQFALTTAQMMLKAGYHVEYVIEFTGIGYLELNHIELDEDGYGVTEARKAQELEEVDS